MIFCVLGGVPYPDDVDWSKSPVNMRNKKPSQSALKKTRSFGGSRDFSYIDEDSGDEMVQHLGRPPSIYFKDRKKNKRKPSFLSRLLRSPSKSKEERKKVKRPESLETKIKKKEDQANFGTF